MLVRVALPLTSRSPTVAPEGAMETYALNSRHLVPVRSIQ